MIILLICSAFLSFLPTIASSEFIAFWPPSSNAGFFLRSIFRALKNGDGQFSSEIQTYEYSYLNTSDGHRATVIRTNSQTESYSFATNSGLYVVPDSEQALTHLYLNGTEIHSYRDGVDDKFCDSRPFSRVEFQRHLGRWLPLDRGIFDLYSDYNLLGLNVLLELLYRIYDQDPERVQCEATGFDNKEIYKWNFWASPRKCTIAFGRHQGESSLRLAYSLVSNENYTDYPTKIVLTEQNSDTGEWQLKRQFKYLSFSPSFSEAEQIVNDEPPARKACKRLDSMN